MTDKLKRFLDIFIDTEICNFKCHYCYIGQLHKFNKKLFALQHSPEEIGLLFSKERLGGTCLINLCAGGETLLSADVLPVIKVLLDAGHYVMVVTNGSMTNRFEEICETFTKEEKERLFFKFSFHYFELIRLNLLDRYFSNVQMIRDEGISFTVEITPNDELIPHIDEIKKICTEKLGTLCHVTVARDNRTYGINHLSQYDFETYKKTWETFSSTLFDLKKSLFYKRQNQFCYAGDWSLYINLSTGDYYPCNCGRKLGNLYSDKKIHFKAIGRCALPHCFNGHAWLALGCIPHLTNITYADVRDRIDADGRHWLQEQFRNFVSQKLEGENVEYTIFRKIAVAIPAYVYALVRRSYTNAKQMLGAKRK